MILLYHQYCTYIYFVLLDLTHILLLYNLLSNLVYYMLLHNLTPHVVSVAFSFFRRGGGGGEGRGRGGGGGGGGGVGGVLVVEEMKQFFLGWTLL